MENNEKKVSGIFEALGTQKTFIFGIVAGIMALSTVGFFFLLLSGSVDFDANSTSSTTKTTFGSTGKNNTNTTVTNTAPVAVPTGQIDIEPVTSDDHIKGDLETADVVVVEFSDTECPFCARFHPSMQQVYEDYEGQVAWVYRHFPLDSLHSKARSEAVATECAAELGGNDGFWAFTDMLYDITPSNDGLAASQLSVIAGDIGLDVNAFETCLDSGKYDDKIAAHVSDATASGGTGTPYSVAINKDGQMAPINGAQPVSSIKATIDSLL